MADERPGDLPHIPELDEEYQLIRELGRGGTAVVYLARDRELGRDVAIKLIRSTYVQDEDAIARLLREARTIGKLQHPCIVMLLGTRRLGDNGLALILQYMPGATLKDRIQSKGPLPYEEAERILRDLGGALRYAHQQRIVHRDIKPENIYLDDSLDLARLADFGLARAWDSDSGLTLPGTAIGTPAYMSPEQVDGKELDGRSDIYSLGLVGYEMLTGRQPWAGEGLYNVIYKQKNEELPPISNYRPDVPDNVLRAIEGAIQKAPDDRWKDAGAFLETLAEGSSLPPPSPLEVDEIDPEAGWEVPLDAMADEGMDPAAVEGAGAGKPPSRSRTLVATVIAVLALVSFSLVAIGIGGQSGPVLGWLGSVASSTWDALTGPTEVGGDEGPSDNSLALGLSDDGGGGGLVSEQPPPDPEVTRRELPFPAAVEVLAGDRQIGSPGATLPQPVRVRITDEEGNPLAGVPVVFDVMSGGGSSNPQRAVTDQGGAASAAWTLGSEGEEGQMLVAWAEGLEDEGGVFLAFLEDPGTEVRIPTRIDGLGTAVREGTAGREVSDPLEVRVFDESGSPVPGAAVRFVIESGDGQVDPALVTTDSEGIGRSTWTLGPLAGNQAVVAQVEGLADEEVRFESTAETPGLSIVPQTVAGGTHTCTLGGNGRIRCWGGNAEGQLGDGSAAGRLTPGPSVADAAFTRAASGLGHVCALTQLGEAFCWGSNDQGQLGTGSREAARQPTPVVGATPFVMITAGVAHTCGLEGTGAAYCWGSNTSGQLGDGSTQSRSVPTRVAGTTSFRVIAAGWQHTCALDGGGVAYCWGANGRGQLGSDAEGSASTPAPVVGGYRFRALAAGNAHTCGLALDDRVLCWGANDSGQLGDGSTEGGSEPRPVATTARFSSLAAGGVHVCGLTTDGGAMCWGSNVYGQLGDGTTQSRNAPVPVGGSDRFTQVSAFGSHNCGLTLSGPVRCWGYNVEGQLGDGTSENRRIPTSVADAAP